MVAIGHACKKHRGHGPLLRPAGLAHKHRGYQDGVQDLSGQGRIGMAVTAFCGLPSITRSLYTR